MESGRRTRVVRFLRIFVSGATLVLCVLIIGLWVRSYKHRDVATLGIDHGPGYAVESVNGSLALLYFQWGTAYVPKGWGGLTEVSDFTFATRFQLARFGTFGFKSFLPASLVAVVPHWFPFGVFATMAALCWLPWLPWSWRFSLRFLLVVTTLVAVVLGLIMYAAG